MNIFKIILLDVILLIFPQLIYLIYLSTNKDINNKTKKLYTSFSLMTSFFLVMQYSDNFPISITILVLNVVVILSYIQKKFFLANIFAILILFIYNNQLNNIYFLVLIYLGAILLYLVKLKYELKDYIFIHIFSIISVYIYIIWIYLYNRLYFNLIHILIITISYIFIVNITILIYETSKKIILMNVTIKELQKEKNIRLSLFKITHEIKNPIAVCKGYLDMINVNDNKQVQRYIPILKSEIDRLLSILQDFLLINKSNLDIDIMDLNMLVEDNLIKLKPLLNEKNIELNLDLYDDEIFINGDYNRLSQVVINILKNSIESISNDGKINISSSIKKDKYYLYIEDNGCGMTKEILQKIKEPFYTTKKRGSGLGVSLIYEIIEAHDAKINYESEYGSGTKVTLIFSII